MRIAGLSDSEASTLIQTAMDEGINFFDHADIYSGGKSEEVFARTLAASPGMREKLLIQTKCGIRDGSFDFSKNHIFDSVDGSLNVDHIEVLLLHRPDTLMEPEEVAGR